MGDDTFPDEWKAHWIWQEGDPAKPNTYVYFRREYHVNGNPKGARCRVSADTSYQLFINEREVGRGPVLTEPRWQSYDIYDVSDFVKKGTNVICAMVYHYGNSLDNPDGYTVNDSRGGFICQIDMKDDKDNIQSLVTDSNWFVLESRVWHRNSPKMDRMTYAEIYDARNEPGEWLKPDYNAKGWAQATIVTADKAIRGWIFSLTPSNVLPWVMLERRPIPYFVHEWVKPVNILQIGEVLELAEPNSPDIAIRVSIEHIYPSRFTSIMNAESILGSLEGPAVVNPMNYNIPPDDFVGTYDPTIVLDFGKLINGRISIDIEAQQGAIIDIGYGQILVDGRLIPYLSNRTVMADQYSAREGRQIFQTYNWRHFRYVQLTFRNATAPLKIHDINAVSESYPAQRVGSFKCNDEMLNWIWSACIDTALLCMYDRFMDNPFRERREYTGDVANILHAIYAAFGDIDLTRKYFKDVKRGQTGYGVIPSVVLGNKRESFRTMIDGGIFVLRVWEYYQMTGNKSVIEELFEPLYTFVQHIRGYTNENGVIAALPYATFIDWADIDRRGISLPINACYAQAVKVMGLMAQVLGREQIAEECQLQFEKIKSYLADVFWDENKGVFIDALIDGVKSTHVSEHANFLMILLGIANDNQIQSILNFLKKPTSDMGQLEPLFFWASEALFYVNQGEMALNIMRQRYSRMKKQGLNTVGELWSLYGEKYTGRWRSRDSRSAAQSGGVSAAYLLSKYVLGISPAKPGFEEVLITPRLYNLTWARGTMPSPKGAIAVKWKVSGNKWVLECNLPKGVPGRLVLPPDVKGNVVVNVSGRIQKIESAKKIINIEKDSIIEAEL